MNKKLLILLDKNAGKWGIKKIFPNGFLETSYIKKTLSVFA